MRQHRYKQRDTCFAWALAFIWPLGHQTRRKDNSGGGEKWSAYGLVSELDWLTRWSAQRQTQWKGKVSLQRERIGRWQEKEKQDGLFQLSKLLPWLSCPAEKQHDAWQVLTGTTIPPHMDPGFRSCFQKWGGDFVPPLSQAAWHECWGYHSSLSALQTMGKASSGDGFTMGALSHNPAVGSASSNGPRWKCGWFKASAAGKRQGSKGGWTSLLEAVDAMAGPCQAWVPTNTPGSISLPLLGGGRRINLPRAPSHRVCIQLYLRITSSHLAEGRDAKGPMSELGRGSCYCP